jgi:hypothetical protein
MFEILPLVALGLAIYALNIARGSARTLGEEVDRLRQEVEALKAGGVLKEAETVPEEPETEVAGPWAAGPVDEAEKGRAILGGEPAVPAEAVAASETAQDAAAAPAQPQESF